MLQRQSVVPIVHNAQGPHNLNGIFISTHKPRTSRKIHRHEQQSQMTSAWLSLYFRLLVRKYGMWVLRLPIRLMFYSLPKKSEILRQTFGCSLSQRTTCYFFMMIIGIVCSDRML